MQPDRYNRHPARDEVFFVQNAGAPAAGTGLNKSSIIQKISLADAEKVRNGTLKAVPVTVVNTTNPQVINPNGGTNHKGNIRMCVCQVQQTTHKLFVYSEIHCRSSESGR